MASAVRHTRAVPALPLMITGVPSGSAPAATAVTPPLWPRIGSPAGVPSAVRQTRTAPSISPLMMTGVPSDSPPRLEDDHARHPPDHRGPARTARPP